MTVNLASAERGHPVPHTRPDVLGIEGWFVAGSLSTQNTRVKLNLGALDRVRDRGVQSGCPERGIPSN
jgi:hypothetical protein